jgi:hypothetical protein
MSLVRAFPTEERKQPKPFQELVAELTIVSKKNPLGLMASHGMPMDFMASLGAVWQVLNDVAAIAA